jgi:hypothetical protein
MSYVTEETIWPAGNISHEIQHVISLFYELADIKDSSVGTRMTKEVFTTDATLVGASRSFHGASGEFD